LNFLAVYNYWLNLLKISYFWTVCSLGFGVTICVCWIGKVGICEVYFWLSSGPKIALLQLPKLNFLVVFGLLLI